MSSHPTDHDAASPFLHGVQEGLFPRFNDTTRCSDSRPPLPPHFVSFAWRYHPCVPCSSPTALDAGPWIILELVSGSPSGLLRVETAGSPKFPGNPRDHSPCSPTPAGPGTLGHACVAGTAPASDQDEDSHEELSGLNHTAFDLAVYASQGWSPTTTQDSLSAAGPALPDGIGYPQGSYKRFQVCGFPPLPSFLAQCQT